MKNNKKPQIRFKGFNDDWEQRKLGEMFKEYSEKNHTELPALTIIQGGGTVKREESDRNLMYDKSKLSNYKIVRKDDFIVHLRSFEGGLEKSSLEGVISPAYHTFHSDEADSRFYYPYFRSHEFIKYKLLPHVYGIRDGRSIDIYGMKTIDIPYTSMEEQRKIGDYLEFLDHLITLHQRKCEILKKIKKSMLEKMFPKNGTKKPKIRFKGFNDDWEQRKLSEISDVRDGTHDSPSYLSNGHPFVTSKNVKDGYINYDDIQYISDEDFETINKRSKVDVNDILMGMIGTIGNLALIRTEPDFAIKNVALIKDTKQVSYMYLYHYLQSSSTERQLLSGLDGGTQKFVSLKNIRELNIMVPSKAEQLKVGNFIESLNHLITLHQRKLEKLKYIKKSMLENMFV